ncbi:MAG: RNA polymerase sigma factor [Eubacterium sp.]|nr:RNA polymerase sigma factor [Eubacterium sp.]
MTINDFPPVGTKKGKAFVIIMVRNKALDNLAAEHIDKIEVIDESDVISDDIMREIMSDMGYKHIVEEILSLDAIYRDILSLRLIYEYSIEEICTWLDISENTAKSRIYRGRKLLKERLEGIYNEQ